MSDGMRLPGEPRQPPASERAQAARDADKAERERVAAEHQAWFRGQQDHIAEQLRAIQDPIERYLHATVCRAQSALSPALVEMVASPPGPQALGRWVAAHAQGQPQAQRLSVKTVFGTFKTVARKGWRFELEGSYPHPHGERGAESAIVLADGKVHYNHPLSSGAHFSANGVAAMARVCGLRDLTTTPVAPQTSPSQPRDALAAVLADRRAKGEDIGIQRRT